MTSVTYAGALCQSLESSPATKEDESALGDRLTTMLQHSDGTRGFFVSYLTNPALKNIAAERDEGVPEVISKALGQADMQVATPLALMNVMMPTATALQHRAAGNDAMVKNPEMTAKRASAVLDCMIRDPSKG